MNFLQFFQVDTNDHKTNFEHVQYAIQNPTEYCLINTLPIYEQSCLIQSTIDASREETFIDEMVSNINMPDKKIIVYGKNTNDHTCEEKCKQFINMGLSNVYIYSGGMFEWMLLQDIYGKKEFPTTVDVLDILMFKPMKR